MKLSQTNLFIAFSLFFIIQGNAQSNTKIDNEIRAKQIAGMKFGMFICWSMAGTIDVPNEYVNFPFEPKQFNVTGCNTDQWCKTAKKAGMGYILFLTKHHDGFCLWDTKTTDLKVTNSPLKRDVLNELRKSCKKYGIKLALYFSEGDWAMERKKATVAEQAEFKKAQLRELLTNYGPIEFIWFDHAAGNGGLSHEETTRWVESLQPNCFAGYNNGTPSGRLCLRERGKAGPLGGDGLTWCSGQDEAEKTYKGYLVAEFTYPICQKYWFFNVAHPDYPDVSAKQIYDDYCGAVKYGNIFSLDVGINPEGRIRNIDVETLKQVGKYVRGKEKLEENRIDKINK